MPNLHSLGEFGLIQRLKNILPSVSSQDWYVGIGDDTAVRQLGPRRYELVTQDLLLEGVHFVRGNLGDFEALGWKALAVNLSDIAAMGGRPVGAVVGLGLPKDTKLAEVDSLYRGVARAAKRFACPVVGGDTNASKGTWTLAVMVLGETRYKPLLRSAARSGDSLWVTGELGSAALGWAAYKKKKSKTRSGYFRKRWAMPEPRLLWGNQLAKSGMVGAMIDVSDGLAGDLGQLALASKVGFEVALEDLPRHRNFSVLCQELGQNEYDLLLAGGEDYELLFTVRAGQQAAFQRYCRRLRLRATCIGHAVRGPAIRWCERGRQLKKAWQGYRHFQNS